MTGIWNNVRALLVTVKNKKRPYIGLEYCGFLTFDLHLYAVTKAYMKIEGVKEFGFHEMALATNNFHDSMVVGQGGYGKVYKGILADNTTIAIKRALEGSLQGEKEFLTEIQLLSRLHHRNLVALIGYCDEEGEQVICGMIYLFIIVN